MYLVLLFFIIHLILPDLMLFQIILLELMGYLKYLREYNIKSI